MTSPTEPTTNPIAVGSESGDLLRGGVAALETPVEWMRFCPVCECETRFMAGWACDSGLIGFCLWCGAEAVIPFSRMNSEGA
jgi:hypothetical protein